MTSGDHTVKLTDFTTGECIRSLHGHMRTPWVVRFNPVRSNILVSGSLDREVRLWDAFTGECLQTFLFSRPIASISFHASGDIMSIATGHKLYMCRCGHVGDEGDADGRDESGGGINSDNVVNEIMGPVMVLRTHRSLRAVQFHPTGAPYLLTAELHQTISQRELIEHLPLPLATDVDAYTRRSADVLPVHQHASTSGQAISGRSNAGVDIAEASFRHASTGGAAATATATAATATAAAAATHAQQQGIQVSHAVSPSTARTDGDIRHHQMDSAARLVASMVDGAGADFARSPLPMNGAAATPASGALEAAQAEASPPLPAPA